MSVSYIARVVEVIFVEVEIRLPRRVFYLRDFSDQALGEISQRFFHHAVVEAAPTVIWFFDANFVCPFVFVVRHELERIKVGIAHPVRLRHFQHGAGRKPTVERQVFFAVVY